MVKEFLGVEGGELGTVQPSRGPDKKDSQTQRKQLLKSHKEKTISSKGTLRMHRGES